MACRCAPRRSRVQGRHVPISASTSSTRGSPTRVEMRSAVRLRQRRVVLLSAARNDDKTPSHGRTRGGRRSAPTSPYVGARRHRDATRSGAVDVRVGGWPPTAEVLRNLCYRVHQDRPRRLEQDPEQVEALFGATLPSPATSWDRGEIEMSYRGRWRRTRPFRQWQGPAADDAPAVLHVRNNPGAVLLLAATIWRRLRQRQTYQPDHGCSEIVAARSSPRAIRRLCWRLTTPLSHSSRPHRITIAAAKFSRHSERSASITISKPSDGLGSLPGRTH